ncbi:hypothetical protein B566_EDAN011334 [Ephemera danica]|nr:hypothetical protein B566_EDAN011334 [Ephemera danica]
MVARMWPEDNGTVAPGVLGTSSAADWILGEERLPLVIAAIIGGALLLLAILAVALWRCYNFSSTAAKHSYCIKEGRELPSQSCHPSNIARRDSAVCVQAGMEGQWAYTSHLLMPAVSAPHWFYNSRVIGTLERLDPAVPRSISVPHPATVSYAYSKRHQRPLSQPIVRLMPCELSLYSACQFASSGALEEHAARGRSASAPSASAIEESLRTRSLPSWVRSRSRPYPPLSSVDDLTQLYAQVNLSKKRRNRMRNGEAAIIALSRSRSRCHLLPSSQPPGLGLNRAGCSTSKDTESLVDHEAVIVYDERTAV